MTCITYAAGRLVPVGHMVIVAEGIDRIDRSDRCLAGRPCQAGDRSRESAHRQLERTGSRWEAVEDESQVDSLGLALVELVRVDLRPDWQQLGHGCAPLRACAACLPPSSAPSTPCGSL